MLSACANQAGVDSSVTPAPAPTTTIVRSTRTPGMVPSRTPMPQEPTDQPSRTPQPTATEHPTSLAYATLVSIKDKFPELKSALAYEFSPFGHWAAFSTIVNGDEGIILVEINGNKKWTVSFYDLYGKFHDRLGYVGVDHWSWDNRRIYLIAQVYRDGNPYFRWFSTGDALIRFNMEDGSWVDMNIGNSWSFSGDERYLVYSADDGAHLRTMVDGSEFVIRLPEKFTEFGRFVWSQESKQFAFTATHGNWSEGETGFTVFLFDTNTLSLTTLLEDDLRFLYPVEWTDSGKITFHELDTEGVYSYDLTTNEIVPAPSP